MALATELRLQQLEARLGQVEAALRSIQQPAAPAAGDSREEEPLRHLETLQQNLEDGGSISSSELVHTQSERFEEALFTSDGDEIRAGITTKGPCYELKHSVWDACLFIGLPTLSKWDSALAGLLLLLNMFTQIAFVLIVRKRMLEGVLQPDELTEYLQFRTKVAHDVKYADLVGGRSMARQVCSQDESLQWANAQTGIISDLNDYISIGPILALLAIGCWLSTTLRELFNIMGFVSAIRGFPPGEITVIAPKEDGDSGRVVLTKMSTCRKYMVYIFVALPRLVVGVALAITGTSYLANTLNLADLILNAVALAFILDIDELIESAFMPRRARFLLNALGTLPIARLDIPGLAQMGGGFQERLKNLLKVALLLLGLSLAWVCLLQPLHDRVRLAHNILCSGRQDFIYTVNAATGLVEATPTFPDNVPLTGNQESVLRLAEVDLFSIPDWYTQQAIDSFQKNGAPAILHTAGDGEKASMNLLFQLLMLAKSDVEMAAERLPCMDEAFPASLVRDRLRHTTNETVGSCMELAEKPDLCADMSMNTLRSLCPQACGCDEPINSAAAAFATVPYGCPKMCMPQRATSLKIKHAPCTDMTPEEMASSQFIRRYFHGLYAVQLGNEEFRTARTKEYTMSLNSSYYSLLPGPNKTESLLKAGEFYRSGGWHDAMANANYMLGLGIPHPRGLTGCAFLDSEEVKAVAGGGFCLPRTDGDLVVSLRAQCPVTCGCKADERDCPGTCPTD